MKYQATVRVTFEAMDDIEARKWLLESSLSDVAFDEGAELKLQEVYNDRAPRGIAAEIKAS
jgi:hypothetical protein